MWISISTSDIPYGSIDDIKHKVILKKGTPVIFTHGLADNDEVIIKSKILYNILKNDNIIESLKINIPLFKIYNTSK